MSSEFSTGSPELDSLLEELRAGDNVVFYTREQQDYLPFIASLLDHVMRSPVRLVYVRSEGLLDAHLLGIPDVHVLDMARVTDATDPLGALQALMRDIGPRVVYLFEPLATLAPWLGDEAQQRKFFLTICPYLFKLDTVAYWALIKGDFSSQTIAAIKDCTQIFLDVDRAEGHMLITPVKVWGRYSETMFYSHRISWENGKFHISPLPVNVENQRAYTLSLEAKNRELAEIRDALDQSNQTLKQRNKDLAELNERLSEQSRLYQSLRVNLDHLLALFHAGQDIGSSLAVDQVCHAIVTAALRLFNVSAFRLALEGSASREPVDISEGMTPEWLAWLHAPEVETLRAQVRQDLRARALTLGSQGSATIAPFIMRGACLGTLEVYAPNGRLDSNESPTLLSYLASEAGIALDNAYLYREVEVQSHQLRSFVEKVITTEEQESRQLAFDLHDGLVQIIVASYQHLQASQAANGRNPALHERELEQGIQLLRKAIYEARRLIGQLRPVGLDDFGLAHALRLHVAQLAADANWGVTLDVDSAWPSLPPALEAALFRIVQEATANAQKYANSTSIAIQLTADDSHLKVRVQDWGQGFDPQQVRSSPEQGLRMGLIGIRERARLWGGECTIKSQKGKGTTIQVMIPKARIWDREKDKRG